MKVKLGNVNALEKVRDCYLMAAALTDLRCNLQKAVNAVVDRDGEAAKDILSRATENAQVVKDLYPGRADQAKKIMKDLGKIRKVIPDDIDDKNNKIKKKIWDMEGDVTNLRAGTKVRCGVPLPFQEQAKKRKG